MIFPFLFFGERGEKEEKTRKVGFYNFAFLSTNSQPCPREGGRRGEKRGGGGGGGGGGGHTTKATSVATPPPLPSFCELHLVQQCRIISGFAPTPLPPPPPSSFSSLLPVSVEFAMPANYQLTFWTFCQMVKATRGGGRANYDPRGE